MAPILLNTAIDYAGHSATFLGVMYPTWWFIVVGFLITGYGILDGFDFGAAAWHLFLDNHKENDERRVVLNAIGPVWDGNEAWLVIGGASIFAGFPVMYASLFSAMNTPFMLFLIFLIFRAISIEFRGKEPMQWWRNMWDTAYSVSSVVLAFLLGVVLGNVLQGLPLDANHEYTGEGLYGALFGFLNPYSLVTGAVTLFIFVVHGGLYLLMKTHGTIHDKLEKRVMGAFCLFLLLLIGATIYTFATPHLAANITGSTALIVASVLTYVVALCIPLFLKKKAFGKAFVSSALTIVMLMALVALNLHPIFLRSTGDPTGAITVYNAAATDKSLGVMLIIGGIGTPLLLAYTYFAYKVFRGKVQLDEHSY